MPADLSNKRIIMIHGLAGKPPRDDLYDLWSECLIENVRCDDPELATALERRRDRVLRMAYWANAIPHHIEDDAYYVAKLRERVDAAIDERRRTEEFHVGTGEALELFYRSRGAHLAAMIGGALTIKDDVMRAYFREVELYDRDQYIADLIREPLEEELRQAWDDGCEVAVLAHSMGTFVAYDVLWRFSHRNVAGFRRYRRKRVKLFVTMGSPLGDSTIRDLLFARHHRGGGRRQFPTNLDFWHNYSCLGDVVCYQGNFRDAFYEPMRRLRILPREPDYRAIDYVKLHNPFQVVEHQGNKDREKRNPHKSYGYLTQPRLGTWVADFLKDQLRLT